MVPIYHLTEETLLRVIPEVFGVIKWWLYLKETLQLVHSLNRIGTQLVTINDVQLLGRIIGQPTLQVLRILARIQASVPQFAQRLWCCITGCYYLMK